jgi:hypothetical protein
MEASQHSLLAACFTLHSINATLAIVPQRGAGLWIIYLYPEPDESSLHNHTLPSGFFQIRFFSHVCTHIAGGFITLGFPTKTLFTIFLFFFACYVPCLLMLLYLNNLRIGYGVQMRKLVIMQLSSASCCFHSMPYNTFIKKVPK